MSPSDEDLRSLARAIDRDPAARLAAAVILRRRDEPAPRVYLDEQLGPVLRTCMADAMVSLDRDPGAVEPIMAFALAWLAHDDSDLRRAPAPGTTLLRDPARFPRAR